MAESQTAAPVLSTPDSHVFEDPTPPIDVSSLPRLSDEQVHVTYEIARTIREIRDSRWQRIALQFPDEMLVDAPRVYEGLKRGLRRARDEAKQQSRSQLQSQDLEQSLEALTVVEEPKERADKDQEEIVFILGDTSYGSCCVDEVAAEHVDADVVIHYGRSCLSPTSRLPVIYVFTTRSLDGEKVLQTFKQTYPDRVKRIMLMADIPYSHHVHTLAEALRADGYSNIFATQIQHNPSSAIPNRTVPADVRANLSKLREYDIFHISQPLTSLLLTLSSRAGAIHIYPTSSVPADPIAVSASSAATLRRRYALLTSLSTCSIFGILINTLSVKNYLHIVEHVKDLIATAGKKSYTFVVGKINAAKVANFSEIGGWVIIGCWESSLVESRDFYRPIITPFELSLALKSDSERMWTGEWTGDFEAVLKNKPTHERQLDAEAAGNFATTSSSGTRNGDFDSESEDEPPEFDLRTGRYVSHSRPLRPAGHRSEPSNAGTSQALTRRAHGNLIQIGGVASPGAAFLQEKRTWKGLGSDYDIAYQEDGSEAGARVEEGRSGIAKGYTVGSGEVKT